MINITPRYLNLQTVDMPLHFDKEFEFDETLSDHLPNIKEILCVEGNIIKNGTSFENDKPVVEMTIRYKLFYISDDNCLCVHSFTKDTTVKIVEKKSEGSSYFINAQLYTPSFRMLNQRKVFVKSKVLLDVLQVSSHSYSTISDIQQECCLKTISISPTSIAEICHEGVCFDDVLSLGDGYDPIDYILDTNAVITNFNFEYVSGYLNTNANILISILYISEVDREKIVRVERNISFEKSIPCASFDDGYECLGNITVESIDATPQIDTYGEYRTVSVTLKLNFDVKGTLEALHAIVNDVFSPGMTETTSKELLTFSKMLPKEEKVLTLDGIIPTNELSFSRIISSMANIVTHPSNDEESNVTMEICTIGETDGGLRSFTYKKEIYDSFIIPHRFTSIDNIECSVSIAGANNLSYKVTSILSSIEFAEETVDAISNVEFSSASDTQNNLIIYYPTQNEELWDISKRYHVSPDVVKELNPTLSSEKASNREIIVIKNK